MAAGVNKEKSRVVHVVRCGVRGGRHVRARQASGWRGSEGEPWYELALVGEKRKKNHH